MSCDHYWKKSMALVELGEADPHLSSCPECAREHRAHEEMIRALPLIGGSGGDPMWQERVWSRIAMQRAADSRSRMVWRWGGGLVVAAAALALWVQINPPHQPSDDLLAVHEGPRYQLTGSVAMRSSEGSSSSGSSKGLGQKLEVWGTAREEVRVYIGERLLLRCARGLSPDPRCVPSSSGLVARLQLDMPGEYRLLAFCIDAGEGEAKLLPGTLNEDVKAIMESGRPFQLEELPVR